MLRNFNFDYDSENDNLFMYDPNSKSKASIEMDGFIIDFNSKKEVSGIEIMNASKIFKNLSFEDKQFDVELLNEIKECKVEILKNNNFLLIKFLLLFDSHMPLATPIMVPTINEPSPALAGI